MIASVFRNSAWSLIGNLGPLLVVLAAMPLTLRLYSAEQIGLIVILWAVLGYFGLLDLGLSRAVTYAIAAASKNAEPRRNAQIVTCGISLGIGIGLVLAAALWHFSAFIVAQLLGAESALFQEMVAALRVAAVSLPVVLMSTILRGALEGVHDFKFVSTIKLILGSVLFGAPILAFPFGGTLAQVTAVIAVSRLFAALAYGLRLPGLLGIRLADCAVSGDTLASLLRYGGWLSVSYFVVPILAYVDRFFISNALGPAEVAFYGVPHEILLKSTVFPAAIVLVLFPTFVQRTAQSDHAALRDQYQAALSIIATVMHLFAIVCILTAAPLLRLWLGEEFAANSATVVQLVVIGCYASALMRVPLIHVQAAGYPHRPAVIHLIELPIYLFLVLPVAVRHGIDFVAAAWSARCLVDYWLLLSQSALISDGGVADRRVLFATAILQPGALILLMLALHLGGAPAIVALAFLLALGSVALTATPSDLHRLKRELSSLLRS